jgi:hypothetical protein
MKSCGGNKLASFCKQEGISSLMVRGVIQFDGTGYQVITVKLSWSSSWLPDTSADGRTTS